MLLKSKKRTAMVMVAVMVLSLSSLSACEENATKSFLADTSIQEPVSSPVTEEDIIQQNPLTAMEALTLACAEAEKITEEPPMLIHITSTDADAIFTGSEGADGKRRVWNILFGSAKGDIHMSCSIKDGQLDNVRVSKDDNNALQKGMYLLSDIKIDSPEAVQRAVESLDMQPGDPLIEDDWIKGYHFTVYGALTDPDSYDMRLVLRVMGISPNSPNADNQSMRMNVFFDGRTGEMLSATEQTGYDEDGHSTWRDIEIAKE